VQRPIPIWLGGEAEAVLKRVARLGDGWFPQMGPTEAKPTIERLRNYIREAGRSADSVGIEARLSPSRVPESGWIDFVEGWRKLGATHISINTMGLKLPSVTDHLDLLRRVKDRIGA